jgi:hypothetical protein
MIASKIGKDYIWWFRAFSTLYDSTDKTVLNVTIKEAAPMLAILGQ